MVVATFVIVIAIAIAALIAYVLFGGPRIPSDLRRAIDEVVASEVPELVAKMLAFGLRPSPDDVRDLGQLVLYDLRKRRGASLVAAYHQQVAAAASAPPRCGASGRRRTDARRAWRHRLRTRGPVRRFGDRGVPRPVVG